MADTIQEIARECDEIKGILQAKNRAYGDSVMAPVRVFSKASPIEQLLVRLDDKISRLTRGSSAGEDVELDLIGYLILLRIARRAARPSIAETFAGKTLENAPQPLAPDLEEHLERLRAAGRVGEPVSKCVECLHVGGKHEPDCSESRATANVPHEPGFFAQMNTCRDAYIRLGLAFSKVIPRGSVVLELGCGTGHQTAALARMGYNIVGVDPMAEYVEPGFHFMKRDPLSDECDGAFDTDVVICTETAEHIYEERADRLVEVCAVARKRVIWSAARPGQEWEGHVNLQPPGYWHEKFRERGFEVAVVETDLLRLAMLNSAAQHCGAVDNFWVLDRV